MNQTTTKSRKKTVQPENTLLDVLTLAPRQQIESLIKTISQGLYEKDHILAIALLCAVSGESVFLLGPPGTAKSEVSRRLKMIFKDAKAFEYLMSRFSTPDEIFGPVSIQKLKNEDTYERKVAGFLPDATIVFLDEIWKAGPAIQNALLTVINEKIYQNGTHTLHVPMKCLIAASNELPAEDEGLEALWDRFLVRVVSNCIENEKTFYRMLTMTEMPTISVSDDLLVTDELYSSWQKAMSNIDVPEGILLAITSIRKALAEAGKQDGVTPFDYYISDRRWRKVIHLLRAAAFLNGRAVIDYSDLLLLYHILWNKVECIEPVLTMVSKAVISDLESETTAIEKECDERHREMASKNPKDSLEEYKTFDFFYLGLQNHPRGKVFFNKTDYKYIPIQGESNGIMYFDQSKNAYYIRHYDKNMRAFDTTGKQNVTAVKLRKGYGSLIVDGQAYPFIRAGYQPRPAALNSMPLPSISDMMNSYGAPSEELPLESSIYGSPLVERINNVKSVLALRFASIQDSKNLFVSSNDISLVQKQVKALKKRLDVARSKAANL